MNRPTVLQAVRAVAATASASKLVIASAAFGRADAHSSDASVKFVRCSHLLSVLSLGLLVALGLSSSISSAQQSTGQISGSVSDPTGAVIPGATVTVKNSGTNAVRTGTTNGTGTYTMTGLEPATYTVTVSTPNFSVFNAQVEVTVAAHVTVDAKLNISASVSQVEVVAEGGSQVNTQTQELSQIVGVQQVQELPSLTRNPYDFVVLSGNISSGDSAAGSGSNGAGTQNATTRGVGFNINGQRSTGTEILLDGVENVSVFGDGIGISVPVNGVQEYRVTTTNFEPQYGRASGGVVNVTTRAGTNAFHGSAWEFNRLAAYTANTYTNATNQDGDGNPAPIPRGQYTRNQFGFAVGGPVLKNKLFFFSSTEWTRVRSAANITAAVPTPQFLALAAPSIQSYFQTYGGGKNFNFTNTYTASDVGITGIPDSTPVFGTVAFSAPTNAGGSVPQNTYDILGRADYNPSGMTQMFFRYVNYKEVDQIGALFASPYSQYDVGQTVKNQAYLYSLSHLFSPNLITSTKLSFSRFNTSESYDTSLQNVPTLYVSASAQVPGTNTFIQLPGFFDNNPGDGGLPFGGPQNTAQINEDVTWVKGRHTMQGGAQLINIQSNNAFGAFAQATEQLGNDQPTGLQNLLTGDLFQFEAAVDPKGALPCVANPYTGDLTQTPGCSINLPASAPSFARSDRFNDWAVYAQDSMKLNSRLQLNYGVRYEYYGVQHNNHTSLDSNFYYANGSLTPQNIRNGQVYNTPNSPIHGLWKPQYGTVAPRVGLAYDLFGNGHTSFRAGFGLSYERNFGNITFNVIQNPPNYAVIVLNDTTVTNSNSGPLSGSTGSVPLPPTSLRNVDQNIRTAQTQFYSAALEQQLTPTTFVSLQYSGARGLHLYDIKNINGLGSGNALLGDPTSDADGNTGLTRLNPQYSNINNRGSNGDSYYHGLNVQFQSSNLYATGLSLVANYTYSHALDDLSTTFSETNNAFNVGYTDPFNPALDHGNSDLDVRHRLVVAPIYQENYFKHSNYLMREALAGWELTGIFTARTGTPFSFFDTTNNASGYNFPRYTPADGVVPKHTFKSIPNGVTGGGANFFVIGNLPPANSFGNPDLLGISDWGPYPQTMTARNAFRGPGAWNLDAAVSKSFPIHEQVNLTFRAEAFDVFNHHNLYIQEGFNDVFNGNGNSIIASKGGIGNNGGANDERRFGQFSLSLNF